MVTQNIFNVFGAFWHFASKDTESSYTGCQWNL